MTTISENALTILKQRYLTNGETPEEMFKRVSFGNNDYFNLMASLRFLPNSPTLFNAGLGNGCTLSACFVFNISDEMLGSPNSIVGTREKAVAVAKAGGGVGYYFGDIRPKGSLIKSVHRKACGPVAVLKDYHAVRSLVTQGGKRDLAQMGILPAWHQDIREFIHCKDEDPQSLSSFNISVSWPDEMMKQALIEGTIENKLWNEQIDSAWHTGDPGLFFPDIVNKHNPNKHLGLINASNPCGETPNRNDEPCNLGSLNVSCYEVKGKIDWNQLYSDAYLATCFLDDILENNVFPHPQITKAALLTRKLGLGVMGWADLLALLHIHYDTEEAVQLADDLMGTIAEAAFQASEDIAEKKGPYKGYSDKTEGPCARNETRTSIAPTGTISLIAGCSSGIEPHFALEWERTTNEGIKLKEKVPVWDRLDGFIPKTAGEIPVEWHVKHQAAFQKHTDLGVSKTINLPNSATKDDVAHAYKMMWDSGCKGGTVYRDGCRSEQVLVTKKTTSVYTVGLDVPSLPKQRKMPITRKSETHKFRVGGMNSFVTVGLYEDGAPGEIFLRVNKIGSTVAGMLDTWAVAFSIALQNGTPLQDLCEHHIGTRFEPCGLTGDSNIPACSSIPDYVCRWLKNRFLTESNDNSTGCSGQLCPECGVELIFQSGCLSCLQPGCGWTKCG